MTDNHVIAGALAAGFGALVAAIRWAARRLAKAQDASTQALLRNAESHATLSAKFDALAERMGDQIAQLARAVDAFGELLGRTARPRNGNRPRRRARRK